MTPAEHTAQHAAHAVGSAPHDLIPLGVVRGAWGVKGALRITPLADGAVLRAVSAWWLCGAGAPQPLQVTQVRTASADLVAQWDGCASPEAADALKGRTVAVARSAFPPPAHDEWYAVDLIGCTVRNRSGAELGQVEAVPDNGAQALLQVRAGADQVRLIPLVAQYVDRVDPAARQIEVDWEAAW